MGVIGTGATVALGLSAQIGFSLFNMYGKLGKVVLLGILAGAGVGGVLIYFNQIKPGLEKKEAAIQAAQQPKPEPPAEGMVPPKKGPVVGDKDKPPVVLSTAKLHELPDPADGRHDRYRAVTRLDQHHRQWTARRQHGRTRNRAGGEALSPDRG